jgi:Fic family protein
MEPLLIVESSKHCGALNDLALELAQKSAGFRRSLPGSLLASLADLVQAMNCYYSNLIEGHDTHPIDIERALKGDYSKDAKKRDLQLEARAHIDVQRWIDSGSLKGRAAAADSIKEIHRRFAPRCLTICCGSKTQPQKKGSRSSPAPCATAMSRWDGTSLSAPPCYRAS